ncbi:MAG: hypothetical protein KDA75_04705 [Planctomycetaceae bacterium]|nr:hypothetical protein [Planctomycetaceae bacterium]
MFRRVAILIVFVTLSTGCSALPNWSKPANWWKLNGQPPGGSDSMYFSVPDPAGGDPFLESSGAPSMGDASRSEFEPAF